MAWICEQEGIEADAEALAVLAQAGEGSVRDSLSALDQAIACCGAKLDAAEVRALLGAFSLESLEQVTAGAGRAAIRARMLEVVDELERNGHNLQHFSRELARYFRNLLVARIAGARLTRLMAASAAQREKLAEIAGALFRRGPDALSAALARSVPGFAVLAAAALSPGDRAGAPGAGGPPAAHRAGAGGIWAAAERPHRRPRGAAAAAAPAPAAPPPPPARTGPSPFELDRAKKAAAPPEPQSSGANALAPAARTAAADAGDPRERLHAAAASSMGMHAPGRRGRECAHRRSRRRAATSPRPNPTRCTSAIAASTRPSREVFGRPLRIKVTVGRSRRRRRRRSAPRRRRRRGGRSHQPRAGQSGSAALPRSLRRRGPQSSKSEGVDT